MADSIPNDWAEVLRAELASPWYAQLLDKVKNDRAVAPASSRTIRVSTWG